jgi:AbrB family looped-hinge helix DNA binding protein
VIATLSSRGQIVIPQAVRERCRLGEGDHFVIEDDPETQVVVLRKVKNPGQWFEVYMQCPDSFSVPARRKEFFRPQDELAG